MKKLRWIVLIAVSVVSVSAEMRTWTGVDGVRFKGEFNRQLLGGIQIRDVKGALRSISIDKLSKADLLYLQTSIPPDVDISFRQSSRMRKPMEWTLEGDRTTLYTCEVMLKKTGRMDSKAELTVELYIIGEEVDGDNWILVQYDKSKFVFPEGKDATYEFVVKDVPCRKYESFWAEGMSRMRGVTYLGYIVTVLDSEGKVFDYDTDLATENWMDEGVPSAVEKLRKLAIEGRGSQFSRHFNLEIQKSSVPQIPWFKRTKNPGG